MKTPRKNSIVSLNTIRHFAKHPSSIFNKSVFPCCRFYWEKVGGVEFDVDIDPSTFNEPVIIAVNHTHMFDFFIGDVILQKLGIKPSGLAKARHYHYLSSATLVKLSGAIPIVSKGYIFAIDFINLNKRVPLDSEYRSFKSYLSGQSELPNHACFEVMQSCNRDILGMTYDVEEMNYRDMVHEVYFELMQATIDCAKRALDNGNPLQIFPQGTCSTRLSAGHIGAVQLALALDVPIIPVGISGLNNAFVKNSIRPKRGKVTVRTGEPLTIRKKDLGDCFIPFQPESEEKYREHLQASTVELMSRINQLLEPDCCSLAGFKNDGEIGLISFL